MSDDTSLVERVARAICFRTGCAESLEGCCHCGPRDRDTRLKDTCWDAARAALEAMRTPTEAMARDLSLHWDAEANVWVVTSPDVRGLVLHAASLGDELDRKLRLVVPALRGK